MFDIGSFIEKWAKVRGSKGLEGGPLEELLEFIEGRHPDWPPQVDGTQETAMRVRVEASRLFEIFVRLTRERFPPPPPEVFEAGTLRTLRNNTRRLLSDWPHPNLKRIRPRLVAQFDPVGWNTDPDSLGLGKVLSVEDALTWMQCVGGPATVPISPSTESEPESSGVESGWMTRRQVAAALKMKPDALKKRHASKSHLAGGSLPVCDWFDPKTREKGWIVTGAFRTALEEAVALREPERLEEDERAAKRRRDESYSRGSQGS